MSRKCRAGEGTPRQRPQKRRVIFRSTRSRAKTNGPLYHRSAQVQASAPCPQVAQASLDMRRSQSPPPATARRTPSQNTRGGLTRGGAEIFKFVLCAFDVFQTGMLHLERSSSSLLSLVQAFSSTPLSKYTAWPVDSSERTWCRLPFLCSSHAWWDRLKECHFHRTFSWPHPRPRKQKAVHMTTRHLLGCRDTKIWYWSSSDFDFP